MSEFPGHWTVHKVQTQNLPVIVAGRVNEAPLLPKYCKPNLMYYLSQEMDIANMTLKPILVNEA